MDSNKDGTKLDKTERRKIILRPRSRVDYPRRDAGHNEEYAAEVSPPLTQLQRTSGSDTEKKETAGENSNSKGMGYIGLAFGIASLFIWSIITGPIAVVLGYYSYARGQKTAGAWAMGLGIVSTLSYFVMIPFAR
jgi:hypothetical protein